LSVELQIVPLVSVSLSLSCTHVRTHTHYVVYYCMLITKKLRVNIQKKSVMI
jgi:hypothetical protein